MPEPPRINLIYPPNWIPHPPNTNTNFYVSFVATNSAIIGLRYGFLFVTNLADGLASHWQLWPQTWPADGSTASVKITGFKEFFIRDLGTNLIPK